ncbi:hypothetical protein SAMN05444422_101418 [Halobiforma haloterrestris]|uniref:Uncharacterized protein n=1 Tax=Natronobacterium haloterrestre TaxID=148448 RepID=A0A1I1D8Y3_NATHA|nr:hypothetical protein [Halobiforma haloterrestris]SFB71479.1 hypothetical protein SAMN05444422_101418 [Halobiforma haloterrestris]
MGILDLMLGRTGTGEQGVEAKSYTLPKDTHGFVYPVAVRRAELEAFDRLVEAEADAPYLEDRTDELQDVFDEVLDGELDATELVERKREIRRAVEPVLERWNDQIEGDVGVVYATSAIDDDLRAFVKLCKQRDEDDDDPFDLPEGFPDAAALLKRVDDATDAQYRAVVHTDLLPEGSGGESGK